MSHRTPDPIPRPWLRSLIERLPIGPTARATVWLELRQRGDLWAGVAGAWLVALLLGGILAGLGRQRGAVEPIAWLLPGVCLSIYFGLMIGGGHRTRGLDEFQAALPARRATAYLTRIGLSAFMTLLLLSGSFVLLRGPITLRVWLSDLEVDGSWSPMADMLTSVIFCLLLAIGSTATTSSWRPSGRVMRFAKNWPWLLVIFVTCNDGESPVYLPGLSALATSLFFLALIGVAIVVGWRRLIAPEFLEGGAEGRRPRAAHPLISGLPWWRGVVWRELRSLHWLWVSSLPMIISAVLLFAVTADDWQTQPYRPWVLLFGTVVATNLMAASRWGHRNDLGDAEFLGGLPVGRRKLVRIQVLTHAVLVITVLVAALLVLRLDLVHHLMQQLPPGLRSTLLGTEPFGELFNTETALLLVPMAVCAYLGGMRHASRHSELCDEAAESRSALSGVLLPATVLFVARQGGLWLGWWGAGLIAVPLLAAFWPRAWRAFLNAQVGDESVSGARAVKGYGDQIAMFFGMVVVMNLFLFLFRVGEAERTARIFAASPLPAEEITERLDFGPFPRRHECRAFADDYGRCRDRDDRRTVGRGERSEADFDDRVAEYRAARKDPRLSRLGDSFAASPHDLETFLQRAELALADPRLRLEERAWFARSEWSIGEYLSRHDAVYGQLSLIWKSDVFEAVRGGSGRSGDGR